MISNFIRNHVRPLLMLAMSPAVMAQPQYLHCEYLDGVEANWTTGRIERQKLGSSQYIGMKFSINRNTGEIKAKGDSVVMMLFPAFQPEIRKADAHQDDNYQLIWRQKFVTGYQQVTFLKIREGLIDVTGPFQFTHITNTDWFLSGLCYPSFKP